MMELLQNAHLALPEFILLGTACLALLADLFLGKRLQHIALHVSLLGLIAAGATSYLFLGQYPNMLFNYLFISDDIAHLMKVFICLTVFCCFIYSNAYLVDAKISRGDYYVLALFSTLGMMVLVSAYSLLTLYLGVELLSLPLYALTAIRRVERNTAEAAMKYFVMGAIASGMLLYGISLMYGATASLNFHDIAQAIASQGTKNTPLLSFALVFIVAGLGFKLAAVPFHMWAPDVYQGASTPVTLFISTAPKIAALGMTLRVLTTSFIDISSQWQSLLLIMAILSTGLGNLLAIVQTDIKRLFAYSAISHVGYALFGIITITTAGYAAAMYYIFMYALMSAAAFGLLLVLSHGGDDIQHIDSLKGLNKRHPWIAFLMMIVLFSMAGVPPTVGFFIKLLVLKALVDVHLTWVAVLALMFAVVGAFYYIRIVKVMYFDQSDQAHLPLKKLSRGATFLLSLNGLALLYWGLFPGTIIAACMAAIE